MNTRHAALGVVVIGIIGAGLWWMSQPVPAPETPKPAAAPAAPAPKVAAPVVAPAKVAAPAVAPVAPSAKPQPVATVTTALGTDQELTVAVSELITDLEAQDMTAFVRDFLAPTMMDTARAAAIRRIPADAPPERQAQIEQMLQQQLPQMIETFTQQVTQQMAQDPHTQQVFQKLGAALKQAQNSPPQINDVGNQATYTLETNGDKDVPPSLTFTRKDGKWVIDIKSLARIGQGQ